MSSLTTVEKLFRHNNASMAPTSGTRPGFLVISSVSFVWLNKTNSMNYTNQMNQIDHMNKIGWRTISASC